MIAAALALFDKAGVKLPLAVMVAAPGGPRGGARRRRCSRGATRGRATATPAEP